MIQTAVESSVRRPALAIPFALTRSGDVLEPLDVDAEGSILAIKGALCPRCRGLLAFVKGTAKRSAHFKHSSKVDHHQVANCPLYSDEWQARSRQLSMLQDAPPWYELLGTKFNKHGIQPQGLQETRHWIQFGLKVLAHRIGYCTGPDSEQHWNRLESSSRRPSFAQFLGYREFILSPFPGRSCENELRQQAMAPGKVATGHLARVQVLQALLAQKPFWQLALKLWLLTCWLHLRREEEQGAKPQWLHSLVWDGEIDLKSVVRGVPQWTGSFERRRDALLTTYAEMLGAFPFLEATREQLARVLGYEAAYRAKFIYLMADSSRSDAVKIGQTVDLRARERNGASMSPGSFKVMDSAISLDWRSSEFVLRLQTAKALGASIQKEWVMLPAGISIDQAVEAFRAAAVSELRKEAIQLL